MVNEPHKCDHCDRACGSANEKKRHMELAHREETAMHVCDECGREFASAQGLKVHVGKAHSKMARKPKSDHPWRSPAVMPEQQHEPIPDEGSVTLADLARDGIGLHFAVDYRMELIETLADLAMLQADTMMDADTASEIVPVLARIKAVARHE